MYIMLLFGKRTRIATPGRLGYSQHVRALPRFITCPWFVANKYRETCKCSYDLFSSVGACVVGPQDASLRSSSSGNVGEALRHINCPIATYTLHFYGTKFKTMLNIAVSLFRVHSWSLSYNIYVSLYYYFTYLSFVKPKTSHSSFRSVGDGCNLSGALRYIHHITSEL